MKLDKNGSKENKIIYMPETLKEKIKDVKREIRESAGTLCINGVGVIATIGNLGFYVQNNMNSDATIVHFISLFCFSGLSIASLIKLKKYLKEKQELEEQQYFEETNFSPFKK